MTSCKPSFEAQASNHPDTDFKLHLTSASYFLISAFVLTLILIGYIWWPLAEEYLALIDWEGSWWLYIDWFLLGIFLIMSILIMVGANLRADLIIILVGLIGGLVIEGWGTQTEIWIYYTSERPPLWIIPAWPIASLSIDRLVRILQASRFSRSPKIPFGKIYWVTFMSFFGLMLFFVRPTLGKSLTLASLTLVLFLILTPTDKRFSVLTFLAGSALGYFLELWGTTRQCWTYYTGQTPPLFAVLAHGMASVAFWRAGLVLQQIVLRFRKSIDRERKFAT